MADDWTSAALAFPCDGLSCIYSETACCAPDDHPATVLPTGSPPQTSPSLLLSIPILSAMDASELASVRELLLADSRSMDALFPGALWSATAAWFVRDCLYDSEQGEDPLLIKVYVTEIPLADGQVLEVITNSAHECADARTSDFHNLVITRLDADRVLVKVSKQSSYEPPASVLLQLPG